jgi:hypothetical protein
VARFLGHLCSSWMPVSAFTGHHLRQRSFHRDAAQVMLPTTTAATGKLPASSSTVRSLSRPRIVVAVLAFFFVLAWFFSPSPLAIRPKWQSSTDLAEQLPPSVTDDRCPTRFALMVDAGSTGSRIHVYRFRVCGTGMPKLENESFHFLLPGLSSYAGDPKGAAESLRPLLQAAVDEIPESDRSCTPISVKATAGLRLLGERESGDILAEVERFLREDWPFAVVGKKGSGEGVGIMDGKDEGVFAWITINYVRLLCNLIFFDASDSLGSLAAGSRTSDFSELDCCCYGPRWCVDSDRVRTFVPRSRPVTRGRSRQ